MGLDIRYFVLVDKDGRTSLAESAPIIGFVEGELIPKAMDGARPYDAPHRWQELVPKQEPVGYAVLNSGKKLLHFSTVKSAAQIYKDVCADYTMHKVMP